MTETLSAAHLTSGCKRNVGRTERPVKDAADFRVKTETRQREHGIWIVKSIGKFPREKDKETPEMHKQIEGYLKELVERT